jgi:N-acetylglucosaminyldiphosphoundecaprenol N-acetyl-beta-D-mannosaminyltransferase
MIPGPRRASTYEVCGVRIDAIEPRAAAELIARQAAGGKSFQTHLCNAYTLSLVDSDPRLAAALGEADLNLPDGAPVAWLGRNHGTRGPVRGPGLVGDVVNIGRPLGLRHFLYGGTEGVARAMTERLCESAPGVQIVGGETPPFHDLTDAELDGLAGRIAGSGANIVWVGLGTPRQDYVVPQIAERFDGAVIPVGAAFNFWSGEVKQAPKFLHGTGFEWVHRLGAEPRRLWRRYLIGNPRFVVAAVRHGLRGGRRS